MDERGFAGREDGLDSCCHSLECLCESTGVPAGKVWGYERQPHVIEALKVGRDNRCPKIDDYRVKRDSRVCGEKRESSGQSVL